MAAGGYGSVDEQINQHQYESRDTAQPRQEILAHDVLLSCRISRIETMPGRILLRARMIVILGTGAAHDHRTAA
jgi:hypothetical protein